MHSIEIKNINVLVTFLFIPIMLFLQACGMTDAEKPPAGTIQWTFYLENGQYPTTTPAISPKGDIVFCTDDSLIYSLHSNGTLKWQYKTGFGFHYDDSPAIGSDGTIYAASRDAYLYALNPDGTLKWRYLLGNEPSSGPGIGRSGTIYVCVHDGTLRAVRPDGTEKWQFSVNGYHCTSPVMDDEETIYCGSSDRYVYAIHPNGTLKWKFQTESEGYWTASIGNQSLYIRGMNRVLYAFSKDGALKWTFDNGSRIRGVTSGVSIDKSGTIYLGTRDCHGVALTPNGEVLWDKQFEDGPYSDEVLVTPLLGDDGSVYFCVFPFRLYAIYPHGAIQLIHELDQDFWVALAMGKSGILYALTNSSVIAFHTQSQRLLESVWPKNRGDYRNTGSW